MSMRTAGREADLALASHLHHFKRLASSGSIFSCRRSSSWSRKFLEEVKSFVTGSFIKCPSGIKQKTAKRSHKIRRFRKSNGIVSNQRPTCERHCSGNCSSGWSSCSCNLYSAEAIAGIEVPYADCIVTGLVYEGLKDRFMLIVKGDNFISMREEPRLGLIKMSFDNGKLILTADGHPPHFSSMPVTQMN
ncbi:hypothetical protein MTO96_024492 [Rhipicephalus appendiculatus]